MPWGGAEIGSPMPTSPPNTSLLRGMNTTHLSSLPTSTYDAQNLGVLHDEGLAQQYVTEW